MKKIISLLLCALLVSCFMGCDLLDSALTSASEKLKTTADGITITPGETTLKEVLDQWYTYEFSRAFEPITEIEGKKFISVAINIKKDGQDFASVGLMNKTGGKKSLEECTISDVWFYMYSDDKHTSDHKFSEVTVNGENVVGLTKDQIKSKFDIDPNEYSDEIQFVYSGYTYEFKFDENNIVNFVGFDIDEYK